MYFSGKKTVLWKILGYYIMGYPESPIPRSEDQGFARSLCSHAYVGGSLTEWLAYDNLNTQLKATLMAFS